VSAQHTPGPWHADRLTVLCAKGSLVAEVHEDYFTHTEEDAANARLIAAAPTTAQMAMDFTLLVERYVRDDIGEPPVSDAELAQALYALRAHIAKATGSA
jgi:hypothetical protein